MPGSHADGEDLAQLAMQSPVPPEVAAHVAGCLECTKDLSLLKSLLAADGPGADLAAEPASAASPKVAAADVLPDAMADGNDSRRIIEPPEAARTGQTSLAEPAESQSGSGFNAGAFAAALLIFLGAALLAFLFLR